MLEGKKFLRELLKKRSLLVGVTVVPILALLNSLLVNLVYWRVFRRLTAGNLSAEQAYVQFRLKLIAIGAFEFW